MEMFIAIFNKSDFCNNKKNTKLCMKDLLYELFERARLQKMRHYKDKEARSITGGR